MSKEQAKYLPLFRVFYNLVVPFWNDHRILLETSYQNTRLSYELATLRNAAGQSEDMIRTPSKEFPEKLLRTILLFTAFVLDHAHELLPSAPADRSKRSSSGADSMDTSFESASTSSEDSFETGKTTLYSEEEEKGLELNLAHSEFACNLKMFWAKYRELHTQFSAQSNTEALKPETEEVFSYLDECLRQLRSLDVNHSPANPESSVSKRLERYEKGYKGIGFKTEHKQSLLSSADRMTFFTRATRSLQLGTDLSPAAQPPIIELKSQ